MVIIEATVRDPDERIRYLYELEIRYMRVESVVESHRWILISHITARETLARSYEGLHLNTAMKLHSNELKRMNKVYNISFLTNKSNYIRRVVPIVIRDRDIDDLVLDMAEKEGERRATILHNYILNQIITDDQLGDNQRSKSQQRVHSVLNNKRSRRLRKRTRNSGT